MKLAHAMVFAPLREKRRAEALAHVFRPCKAVHSGWSVFSGGRCGGDRVGPVLAGWERSSQLVHDLGSSSIYYGKTYGRNSLHLPGGNAPTGPPPRPHARPLRAASTSPASHAIQALGSRIRKPTTGYTWMKPALVLCPWVKINERERL